MSENQDSVENWKRQNYILGTMVGMILGTLAAYLYNRAAEEDAERQGGKPSPVSTTQLIGLSLALLGVIRQIAELGKSSKKK